MFLNKKTKKSLYRLNLEVMIFKYQITSLKTILLWIVQMKTRKTVVLSNSNKKKIVIQT